MPLAPQQTPLKFMLQGELTRGAHKRATVVSYTYVKNLGHLTV